MLGRRFRWRPGGVRSGRGTHAGRVVLDLSSRHDTFTQAGSRAPGLKRCIDYHIEGTCRYLVKDRMAITGARWSLSGAEAVLLLRVVITNGDFETYWRFHLQQDYQRTHASRYQHQYELAT